MSPILGIWASQNYSRYQLPTSFESIATTTVGSGGAANVEFTSIPSTYTHLQIRFIARTARASETDDNLALQINSNTGSNYAWHQLSGNGTAASAAADSSIANIRCGRLTGANAGASTFGVGVIDILDYTNTNKYRIIRSLSGQDNNGNGFATLFSGLYQSTTAITSIKLFSQTGANNFAQYSHFALYGIL